MIGQSPFEQQLIALVEESLAPSDYCLWGLTYQHNRNRALLRIFIDSDAGICLDDCEEASKMISTMLDVADVIDAEYVLEVSSPGLDRVLFSVEQMRAYQGQQVLVTLYRAVENKRRIVGRLIDAHDAAIEVDVHESTEHAHMQLPINYIKQVRLRTEL